MWTIESDQGRQTGNGAKSLIAVTMIQNLRDFTSLSTTATTPPPPTKSIRRTGKLLIVSIKLTRK